MSTEDAGVPSESEINPRVRKRHVIYCQGYDPRGLAEYYRLFRSEYRKCCELYGLTGKVGKIVNPPDRFTTTWPLDTQGKNVGGEAWRVETTYEFLRWEDIIRDDFVRPQWWKLVNGVRGFLGTLFAGTYFKIWRASWRFALFIAYSFVILLCHLLVSVLAGSLAGYALSLIGAPAIVNWIAGIAVAVAAFVTLVRKTEAMTYMLYLFDDVASTYDFAHGRRKDWEDRFEIFAGYLAEDVRASTADEIVIVGHSSGSFVAVEVVDRALRRDPAFAQGRNVKMLTVGSNLPIIGFHPTAIEFRNRLARLAVEPSIDWFDYQSRKDVMNFYPFEPITGHGLDVGSERRNPVMRAVRFRDLIKPENYGAFRWRFFRVHLQFLMANERKGSDYDYFLICCGPFALEDRVRDPDAVIRAAG
jgi:hypothetical protein